MKGRNGREVVVEGRTDERRDVCKEFIN